MIDHITHLENLPALDQRPARESLSNCRPYALAAVHYEQAHPLHWQAALDQVAQQRPPCLLALAAAFHHSQHSLRPVRLDPHRHQQHVVAEDRAVEQEQREGTALQRLGEPPGDLLAGPRDEAPGHTRPADRARAPSFGQPLQAPGIFARRYAHHHLLESPLVEGIFLSHRDPTRQGKLLASDTADPPTAQPHLPATEDHAALLMPVA